MNDISKITSINNRSDFKKIPEKYHQFLNIKFKLYSNDLKMYDFENVYSVENLDESVNDVSKLKNEIKYMLIYF